MHRIIVEEKQWLDEQHYLSALSFCMLLPGPEAMQLATYAGWRFFGIRGGLLAGLLFVLPGAFVILGLSLIYALFGNVPIVDALFLGIKAAVLIIVIEALLRISKRALKLRQHWIIAAMSFIAIFFFSSPFPLIVFAAAMFGYLTSTGESERTTTLVKPSQTALTVAVWLIVWFVPLGAINWHFGPDHVLSQMSVFFSKLAVVTFGGAYAVLAYMAQDVVTHYGWLDTGAMMDGLGLAETTPGPLILVTEFVGFVAAYRHGADPALLHGLLGAFVALWATFAPCFLWIFAGAPYIEWMTHQPRLRGALSAITAAVVGVVLNLAVWFGLHVFFKDVLLYQVGLLHLWTPQLASLDWRVVALSALSAFLILKQKWDIPATLAVASVGALAIQYVAFGRT
jgi:chromate transporter